jgi:pheganomycin biosynthesis PGM1-like protein
VVPGRYEANAGRWVADDGTTRAYTSTDNLVDEAWHGLPPAEVIRVVREAGLQFDPTTRVGTVLHMLSGLAIDGRFGLTAIAETPAAADEMFEAVRGAMEGLAPVRPTPAVEDA